FATCLCRYSCVRRLSPNRYILVALLASLLFFFNSTATTEIYTLSLHDALPISRSATRSARSSRCASAASRRSTCAPTCRPSTTRDRKSTRLNSSHSQISYAVFCLKKKKNKNNPSTHRTTTIHSDDSAMNSETYT